MSLGLEFIASALKYSNVHDLLRMQIPDNYFRYNEKVVYDKFYEYTVLYAMFPNAEYFRETCAVALPDTTRAPKYIIAKMRERYITDAIASTFEDVTQCINNGFTDKALDAIRSMVLSTSMTMNQRSILDARDYAKVVTDDLHSNIANKTERLWFGWPYLDNNYSNIFKQELVSIVGPTGAGKSYLMLYNAYQTWLKYNEPVLFISMEMSSVQVLYRLLSLANNKDLSKINMADSVDAVDISTILLSPSAQCNTPRAPFHIVDGSLSLNVNEVYSYIKQFGAKNVYVDGAYMVKLARSTGNRYNDVHEATEKIKYFAMECDIPIVCSWQIKRAGAIKKNIDDIDVTDIGLSSTIENCSGLVLAILQRNALEEHILRNIRILKGRHGQYGGFDINYLIRPGTVDFSERIDVDPTLQYFGALPLDNSGTSQYTIDNSDYLSSEDEQTMF